MSALTNNGIAKRARARLTDWPEAKVGFTVPRIETMVPAALEALARNIARERSRRELLVPSSPYTATLVNGVVDLVALIAAEQVLLDFFLSAEIFMADLTVNPMPFQWVGSHGELALPTLADAIFIHCSLTGTVLATRNTDGLLTTLNGDITISASYIPTMPQLPTQLEGELIGLVVAEAQREMGRESES